MHDKSLTKNGQFVNITREMPKSALMTLAKKIQIEILHWKMVKRDEFDFFKIKIL